MKSSPERIRISQLNRVQHLNIYIIEVRQLLANEHKASISFLKSQCFLHRSIVLLAHTYCDVLSAPL